MNYLYYLHFLLPLTVILLPLLPVKYLKYVFWYPALYFLTWYIFKGCPLTQITPVDETNTDPDNMLLPLCRKYINSDMTSDQHNNLIAFIISLSIIVSAYKIIFSKRK